MHTDLLDRAEEVLKSEKIEQIIALGDYVDDWGASRLVYETFAQRFAQFDEAHPTTLYCWGNHDFQYYYGVPSKSTGYVSSMIPLVQAMLKPLVDQQRISVVHKIDHCLFSHAGLEARWVTKNRPTKSTKGSPVTWVNHASPRVLWQPNSPLWRRPSPTSTSYSPKILQVVGHTPYPLLFQDNGFLYTDTWSDTQTHQPIGDHSLAIVDTETGAWDAV